MIDNETNKEQAVYVKVYTTCSFCLGKGEFDFTFVPKKCVSCLGTGKKENFVTIKEFKLILEHVVI